ncbi:MAG: hypothetical protein NOOUEUKL_002065, partial [Candidatus Fervidibacter sp.]
DFVNGRMTVFAATEVDKADDSGRGTRDEGRGNDGNQQAALLNGFFQSSQFDEPEFMPVFICQRFYLSDIASPCRANHHCCHCPSPVKILAHPKIAAV